MVSIDINHPDVVDFVNIKANTDNITHANISVRVNDEFMKAVELDKDYILRWPCDSPETFKHPELFDYNVLVKQTDMLIPNSVTYFKKIKARELFMQIARNNWDYAEPGVLYWDRISKWHMMSENPRFEYAGVNPCAEEPQNQQVILRQGLYKASEMLETLVSPRQVIMVDVVTTPKKSGNRDNQQVE